MTDGNGNHLDYDFVQATVQSGAQQPGALYYQNNHNSYNAGASIHTTSQATCYNNSGSFCIDTAIQLPVTRVSTYQALNDAQQSGTDTFFDTYGDPTEIDTYDFGTSTNNGSNNRGALLAKEVLTYGNCGPANLVGTDTVQDGLGNTLSKRAYCYDEVTPAGTSNVPQHVAATGSRGNLTTATTYTSLSGTQVTANTYNDTGVVLSSTSTINGTASATTQYNYDNTYTVLLSTASPTQWGGQGMTAQINYDTPTLMPTSTIDANNQTTQINNYDALLRPRQIVYADQGRTDLGYTPTQLSAHVFQNVQANLYSDQETLLDGYGRVSRTAVVNDAGSWYQQDTCYDGNGNVYFRSYGYTGDGFYGNSHKVCTGAGDTFAYDVLGRVTSVAHGDGSHTGIGYAYQANAAEVTDENNVAKITQVDGLGRMTSVCELTSATMNGESPVACGVANLSGTGFVTSYAYGYNGNPQTTVTQSAQIRTFITDWIGRTTSTTEPERGTTSYSYSANASGALVTRTRPRANQTGNTLTTTTSQYDLLNRLLTVNYDDGLTPSKTYFYDQTHAFGDNNSPTLLGASKGRLTREMSSAGNGTGEIFGYDAMGRITVVGECRPSTCGSSADIMDYTYDQEGNMLTSSDGSGVVSTYQYTRANELKSLTSSLSGPQYPSNLLSVNTQSQTPFGPLNLQLGNGLSAVNAYDPTGRIKGRWVCANSTSTHNCSGGTQLDGSTVTWQGNRAASGMDTYLNSGSTYGYDDLNRLTSATVNGTATAYSYDRYGNRVSQTPGPTVQPITGNNRLVGFSYDSAGNLTVDAAGNQYQYDAEGNVVAVTNRGIAWTYDAFNQRVRVEENGVNYEFDYDSSGRRVSVWQGNTRVQGQYYAGGMGVGYYANGMTRFQHKDWLGTERIRTRPDGSVEGRFYQGAFGDNLQIQGADTDGAHFAGQDADVSNGTSHAQFRELDITHGKWMSPDPYDGSYDLSNPQSLNRYNDALNNPLTLVDPSGLDCEYLYGPDRPDGNGGVIAPIVGVDCGINAGGLGDTHIGAPTAPRAPADSSSGTSNSGLALGTASKTTAPNNAGTPTVPTRMFGTHYCGPGGAGSPVNGLDMACQAHDACYDANGLSVGSNFNVFLPSGQRQALQGCNQTLCNAASKSSDLGSTRVVTYFVTVPLVGACRIP